MSREGSIPRAAPLVSGKSGRGTGAFAFWRARYRQIAARVRLSLLKANIMRIHAALENLSIRRSVEKPSCNPQRAEAITVCPSFTDFAAL
jgi:hypothetical protein